MLILQQYLTLGLAPGATDEQIRERYLELTRQHPPGREPELFRRIATAYQTLASKRSRVDAALFGGAELPDAPAALLELVEAAADARPLPGLSELVRQGGLTDD